VIYASVSTTVAVLLAYGAGGLLYLSGRAVDAGFKHSRNRWRSDRMDADPLGGPSHRPAPGSN